MISVQEADQIIHSHTFDFGTENVRLEQATNRVLREDLYADRPLPPYHRVTMDGIAIQFPSLKLQNKFKIQDVAAAGSPQLTLNNNKDCFEVMTGSILPEGCDTVIRYEDLLLQGGEAELAIPISEIKQGQNVHKKGSDRSMNSTLAKVGWLINSAVSSVAATVGREHILVSKLPKVTIVSTGDELVDIQSTPKPHQIRKSNNYGLSAMVNRFGIQASSAHLTDDKAILKQALETMVREMDVIILSGGVSKGKFDFVPEILQELGCTQLFHKVRQRPGKPFWFGHFNKETFIFGLPGNPVSSFLCAHRYFLPWLRKSLQMVDDSGVSAILSEDIHFKKDLTYFAQVQVRNINGQLMATPVEGNGSGDLANLAEADGFIELPSSNNHFKKGEHYPLHNLM